MTKAGQPWYSKLGRQQSGTVSWFLDDEVSDLNFIFNERWKMKNNDQMCCEAPKSPTIILEKKKKIVETDSDTI